MADRLFLCMADEQDGMHARMIEFLVRAPDLETAEAFARRALEHEWGEPDLVDDDDPTVLYKEDDEDVARFDGGQIAVHDLEVQEVSEAEAIAHFTRT